MNILRIVYDWPDTNVITEGLAPAPYELSKSQVKLGHKIYVLCGNLNGKNIKACKFHYTIEDGKIEVYNLPRALTGFGPFLSTSIFVLPYYFYLKLTKKIDIVHNQGHMGVWLLLYKQIVGSLDKTEIVGHFHNTAQGREEFILKQGKTLPFLTQYFEYPIHKFSDRLQIKIAKFCVFVSQELLNEAIKYCNADPKKLKVVETGVNTSKFTKEGEKIDFGFDNNSIILANGGRLSTRKGIDILVNALKFLPEQYKVVLWGNWDEDMKQIVKKIVKENHFENRFKYLGPIPYFEVEKYFRSINYFVLPSSYEGLAKVLLEALYTGNKVITTLFASEVKIPNLYMLETNTPEQLAQLVLKIKDNENKYTETKEILDQHFSWDAKAKEIEIIYSEIKNYTHQ